jgi:hypothetical protein
MTAELELLDWRRQVAELYAAARAEPDPARGHAVWRTGRDRLFRTHPQSPLTPEDPLRETGLSYWPYDSTMRFKLELRPAAEAERRLAVPGGEENSTTMVLIGCVELPRPVDAYLTCRMQWLKSTYLNMRLTDISAWRQSIRDPQVLVPRLVPRGRQIARSMLRSSQSPRATSEHESDRRRCCKSIPRTA